MSAENKTKPTRVSVDDFLLTVDEKKRADSYVLIDMMREISGDEPVMWGPSIVGFGVQHYRSEAGREGDMGILGFSPRKANLTVYFYEGFDRYGSELAALGKHTTSVSCLYINKLSDIDLAMLRRMITLSFARATQPQKEASDVDGYVASVPAAARSTFDTLRAVVTGELGSAHEVVSYGVLGYKPDIKKRAVVFVSGWKDHVAVYPIPKEETLREELKPYIKGKGTLWFGLETPLPQKLIQRVVRALAAPASTTPQKKSDR